nr:MAG TPA_asm: nucleoside triphosphate pyrophosphohydrolase [Caudoviricetes sp.]
MKNSNNPYSRALRANISADTNNPSARFWDSAPRSLREMALKAADYMETTTLLADKLTLCHMIYELSEEEFRSWCKLLKPSAVAGILRKNEELLRRALDTYGADAQTTMVFEEMAELQKELCKHARGSDNKAHIAEEIADCLIMLEQMQILFDIRDDVNKFTMVKLERLKERIDERDS